MTSYQINRTSSGIDIEIAGVGANSEGLLAAFGGCAAGHCSCPTDEYEKVESMEVAPAGDSISIRLEAKPGTEFGEAEIARCLDYTVAQVSK